MYVSESGHSAKLSLDVAEFIRNTRSAKEATDGLANATAQLADRYPEAQKQADAAGRAFTGAGKEAKGAAKDTQVYADGFGDLVKEMQAFKEAQRDIAQSGVVSGSQDGLDRAGLNKLSTSDLKDYIAIDDARGQNAVSVARQIVAAREKEITKAEELVAAQARAKTSEIGGRNYSNISTETDAAIAARKQSSSDFSKGLQARMQAQQDGINTDHAAALAINKTMDAQNKATTATRAATSVNKTHTDSMISQRYALYDVATTYGAISAAMIGTSVLAVKAGADFESAFSGVERTTLTASGDTVANIDSIKKELVDLSTQIPVTFEEIAKIATLGAQMGVAADDLDGFSETVAQFATITGVSVDAAAASFGVLGELMKVPASEYGNLGSAISLVGVNSNATEAQIMAVAEQIASFTTLAGYSADETIGLAGALASLKVPPEQARSAIQELFTVLNKSAASPEGLVDFAAQMDMTAESAEALYRSDPEQFVQKFAQALGGLDAELLTLALDKLGVDEKRIGSVLTKMAGSTELLASTQKDSAQGYEENIALGQQYAKVAEDLNMKLQVLFNSVNALIAELSGGTVDGLAGLVQVATDVVNAFREIADNPLARSLATVAVVLTTTIGVFFAFRAASALATASTYALVTAQAALASTSGATGMLGLLRLLAPALMGYTAASTAATASSVGLVAASTSTQIALGLTTRSAVIARGAMGLLTKIPVIGLVAFGASLIALPLIDTYLKAQQTADGLRDIQDAASGADFSTGDLKNSLERALGEIDNFADEFAGRQGTRDQINAQVNSFFNDMGINATPDFNAASAEVEAIDAQLAALVSGGNPQAAARVLESFGLSAARIAKLFPQYSGASADAASGVDTLGNSIQRLINENEAGAAALKVTEAETEKAGRAAAKAAPKIRTLADYASDLSTVLGRAFEIRFSGSQGADDITAGWSSIAKATEDANKSIRDYQQTLRDLNADAQQLGADRKVLEYFKEVADRYGDGLASADLSARLAKNAAEQAKKQDQLTDANKGLTTAQAANSKVLTGNSDAAVANRAQILGLVTSYQDYIAKLAASGMSQSDLAATSARLKQEFMAQATQAGYSRGEIDLYSVAFDDMRVAIDRVPRNITVDANTDPALQALNELEARMASMAAQSYVGPSITESESSKKFARGQAILADMAAMQVKMAATTDASAARGYAGYIQAQGAKYASGSYADGGYTGDGAMYQPAGVVHKGEYVFSKAATSSLGVNNLAKLHSMGKGKRGYSGGGMVGGSSGSSFGGPTDLSAGTIMAIAQAMSQINVSLFTTDRRLAESNNRGQMELASGGTN